MKKPISIEQAEIKAFLGPGSRFEGKLTFDEMVRLDGEFKGEVNSTDTLVVGESAQMEGNISVGALILSGRFTGHISASSQVELRAPAQVEGTIETPLLKIEEKVVFNGEIKMNVNGKTTEGEKKARNKSSD